MDRLETVLPLENSLWDILIRTRFKQILLCGGIEKALKQIRFEESERNA